MTPCLGVKIFLGLGFISAFSTTGQDRLAVVGVVRYEIGPRDRVHLVVELKRNAGECLDR